MKAMIERAERPEHTQIATFKHLRDQVTGIAVNCSFNVLKFIDFTSFHPSRIRFFMRFNFLMNITEYRLILYQA